VENCLRNMNIKMNWGAASDVTVYFLLLHSRSPMTPEKNCGTFSPDTNKESHVYSHLRSSALSLTFSFFSHCKTIIVLLPMPYSPLHTILWVSVSQTFSGRGPLLRPRFIKLWFAAVRRQFRKKKALQKLYQTLNERKRHPYMSVLKLPLLVNLQ
jgi:hypothetical protein